MSLPEIQRLRAEEGNYFEASNVPASVTLPAKFNLPCLENLYRLGHLAGVARPTSERGRSEESQEAAYQLQHPGNE